MGAGGAKYKLVESGTFDLSEHTQDRVQPAGSRIPQKLIVTVTLPENAVSASWVCRAKGWHGCCVLIHGANSPNVSFGTGFECSVAPAIRRASFSPPPPPA